jgi:hypothetical protein
MRFSESSSFLISRRTGSGLSFVPSKKKRPIPYHAKVLGRALLFARYGANSFWMLLAGNAKVAFPSRRITTIAAAANLPTPATDTATVTVNVAPVVATVSAAAASANDGAPAAGQKRKACP